MWLLAIVLDSAVVELFDIFENTFFLNRNIHLVKHNIDRFVIFT
jgi:hypothetical protein